MVEIARNEIETIEIESEEEVSNLPNHDQPVVSIQKTISLGFLLLLSDTPGLQIFCLPILLKQVYKETTQIAAIAPIVTLSSLVMFAGASGIFATNIIGPQIASLIKVFEGYKNEPFDTDNPSKLFFKGKDFRLQEYPTGELPLATLDSEFPWILKQDNSFYFYGSVVDGSPATQIPLDSSIFSNCDLFNNQNLSSNHCYADIYHNIIDQYLITKKKELAELLLNSFALAAINTIISMPFMVFCQYFLENALQQDPEVASLTQAFLRYYFMAIPATFYFLCTAQILNCFQNQEAMLLNFSLFAISIVLAYVLSTQTSMGVDGILVSFIAYPHVSSVLYTYYLMAHPEFRSLNIFNYLIKPLNWEKLKQFVLSGSTLTVSIAAEILLNFASSNLMGIQGLEEQAALALTTEYASISILVGVQYGLTGNFMLGEDLGRLSAGKVSDNHIYQTGVRCLQTSILMGLITPIVFLCYQHTSHDDSSLNTKTTHLANILAPSWLLDVLSYAFIMALRQLDQSARMAWITAFIRVGGTMVGTLIAATFSLQTDLGYQGVALGSLCAMLFSAVASGMLWFRQMHPYRFADRPSSSGLFAHRQMSQGLELPQIPNNESHQIDRPDGDVEEGDIDNTM